MKESLEIGVVEIVIVAVSWICGLALGILGPLRERSKWAGIAVSIVLSLVGTSSVLNFYWILPLPVFIYLNATIYINWLAFIRPGLRHILYRIFISWPSGIYSGACFLMLLFTWISWYFWIYTPLVVVGLCVIGLFQSTFSFKEYVYIDIVSDKDDEHTKLTSGKLQRASFISRRAPLKLSGPQTLRIAQITDTHLGPYMSMERLRSISSSIAKWNPDLVFLTGDFLTMETYYERENLAASFSPLRQLAEEGKVYACLGNHDYESLETVEKALQDAKVRLLKGEEALVNTPVGIVQIIGTEFNFSRKSEARQTWIDDVCRRFPRKGKLRLWLVHNPEEFIHFADGEADLVFSGHTHGGQLGLHSFGLNPTIYGLVRRMPDHGLWQQGKNLLYVHRGTGFYGFPLRLGVSGEQSFITLSVPNNHSNNTW